MSVSFPRTDILSIANYVDQSFQLVSRQELSRTAYGRTIGKDLGSAIWSVSYTTVPLARDAALTVEAVLNSLDGAVQPFEAGDLRRVNPRLDPDATIMTIGSPVPIGGISASGNFVSATWQKEGGAVSSPEAWSFTRAIAAYYLNGSGTYVSVSSNVARPYYVGATRLGVMLEAEGTNNIRNNSMQGAVAGTPGTLPTRWTQAALNTLGMSYSVVGTGTSNGIDYVDIRIFGTSSATSARSLRLEAATQIAAAVGQTWANSAFLALVGGTVSGVTELRLVCAENNAGGTTVATNLGADIKSSLTSDLARFSQVVPLSNADTAFAWPYLRIILQAAAVDFTLRIGWPQLEQGVAVSSPIRTTTIAVTRPAEVLTLKNMSQNNWTITADNDSTQAFPAITGDLTVSAVNLVRPYVKAYQAVRSALLPSPSFPTLNSVNANNKALALSALPPFYVLSPGDYLSFDYAGQRALHQVVEGITANASGTTGQFEVRPHIRPGWTLATAVKLASPRGLFTLMPGSVTSQSAGPFHTTISFQAVQFI